MQNVIKIPGTEERAEWEGICRTDFGGMIHAGERKCLRVAAYGRVSTDNEAQLGSYKLQVEYYKEYILRHPGWELYQVFADEGITGTSVKNRVEFQKMIQAAKEGAFDYIITKSISRFARNTLDTIRIVRELKEKHPPVGIYFEKENIDTLDSKSEFLLTVLAALAQDESRSNSENCKWAIRKRFEKGIARVNLKQLNGYEKGENGQWVIQEEQAAAVRFMFERYVQGATLEKIRGELNEKRIRNTCGSTNWSANTISSILQNEKYMGDVLLQKYYTPDFLNHQSVRNRGELPSYYVREHHPAIVSRDLWEQAQQERAKRRRKRKAGKTLRTDYVLTGKLCCGCCGAPLIHVSRSFGRKSGTIKVGYWACRNEVKQKAEDGKKCHAARLTELAVEQSLMEKLYQWKEELQREGDAWMEKEFSMACGEMEKKDRSADEEAAREGNRSRILRERLEQLERNLQECVGEPAEADVLTLEMKKSLERQLAEAEEQEREDTPQNTGPQKREEFQKLKDFLLGLPETKNLSEESRTENGKGGSKDGSKDGSEDGSKDGSKDGSEDGSKDDSKDGCDRKFFPFVGEVGRFLARGTVEGDGTISYELTAGILCAVGGNRRSCRDFFGWRVRSEDGKLEEARSLRQVLKAVGEKR